MPVSKNRKVPCSSRNLADEVGNVQLSPPHDFWYDPKHDKGFSLIFLHSGHLIRQAYRVYWL